MSIVLSHITKCGEMVKNTSKIIINTETLIKIIGPVGADYIIKYVCTSSVHSKRQAISASKRMAFTMNRNKSHDIPLYKRWAQQKP